MMLMTAMLQQSPKTNDKKNHSTENLCVWYNIHMSIFQIVYSKRYLRKLLELFVLRHKICARIYQSQTCITIKTKVL